MCTAPDQRSPAFCQGSVPLKELDSRLKKEREPIPVSSVGSVPERKELLRTLNVLKPRMAASCVGSVPDKSGFDSMMSDFRSGRRPSWVGRVPCKLFAVNEI